MINLDLWPDVAPLLDRALDLVGDERQAFVTGVEDGGVRAELERYLRYAATNGDTLADLFGPRPLTDLAEGEAVGPYRLGALLGSGGGGAVYRAVDVRADKAVALKVLRTPRDPARAARLEREVRALGRLDHSGVARYLNAGEAALPVPDGSADVLWIAMELVEGAAPVTDFADREGLPRSERVRLLAEACGAVDHALGRAVLHRDLKPSNVLATRDDAGRPAVKVVDFGVGALLDDAEDADVATPAASFRLTPAFAAPEQLAGEPATAATDVWGLGVVGRELVPGAGGDLGAVLAKACAADPAGRYPDAGALGDELARVLATRPVEARGDGALYRATRFVQRRWGVVLATVAVLTLGGVALALVVRAQTWASVESARAGEVTALLTAAFEEADPLGSGSRQSMDEVARRVEQALGARSLRPDVRWEVEALLGSAYYSGGDFQAAFERQAEALALAEQAYGPEDARVAGVLRRMGLARLRQDRFAEADALFDRALAVLAADPDPAVERDVLVAQGEALRESGRADEAKRVLRQAYGLCRDELGASARCAPALQGVAAVLVQEGDSLRAAERLYRAAHDAYRRAYGPDDFRTAVALSNRAHAVGELGDLGLAVRLQRRSLAAVEHRLGPDHPQRMAAVGLLATLLAQAGVTSPSLMAEAQALLEEQVAYHRDRGTGTLSLARALNNLGQSVAGRGEEPDWTSSVPYYEEALEVLERVGASDRLPLVATVHNNLAVSLMRAGDYDAAEPHFQRSLALRRARVGPEHRDVGFFLMTYAQQLSYRDDRPAAEETIDRSIRVLSAALGPEHPDVGMAMMVKGTLFLRWGRREEGMAVGREGARIRQAAAGQ